LQTEKYISLLKNPVKISKKQIAALNEITAIFPYFQSARCIQLKGLQQQNSFLFNQQLKKTAAFTTDRTVLFDFITSEDFILEDNNLSENEKIAQINVIESICIDVNEKKIFEKEIATQKEKELEKNQKIVALHKPISFDKNDAFSFNQWLQLADDKPLSAFQTEEKEQNTTEKSVNSLKESKKPLKKETKFKTKKLDLIERFLEKKPKIKPIKKTGTIDITKDSVIPNQNLMTETLARVYIEQQKYDKAIQAFRILSLKYPEKSSFFANQIKAIEFLKNN